jgi:hypothetical protein
MNKKHILASLILLCLALAAFPQKTDSVKVRLNHYSFNIGAGWTHYIDNLDNGNKDLKQDFAGLSLKFFWEPEYRLSLGLETGYYKLFKSTNQANPDTVVTVDRNVIPLLLLVRMRIIDNFYLTAGTGLAIIKNKAAGLGQEITTSTNSLSSFQLSASYLYPLGKHFRVGGEFKAFHFANQNDWMYSLQLLCAFRL